MSALLADYRKLLQFALTLAAAMLVLGATRFPVRAEADRHMIVIPASDGYGFDDCLSGNKSCGKVIADAWCEAHGMATSLSFGRADDITASVKDGTQQAAPKMEPGAFVVNCSDTAGP